MKLIKCKKCGKEYAVLIEAKITHQNPESRMSFKYSAVCTNCFLDIMERDDLIGGENKLSTNGIRLAKDNV